LGMATKLTSAGLDLLPTFSVSHDSRIVSSWAQQCSGSPWPYLLSWAHAAGSQRLRRALCVASTGVVVTWLVAAKATTGVDYLVAAIGFP
jgi:hypothetical protein